MDNHENQHHKKQENKSKSIANEAVQKKNNSFAVDSFQDNRPEAVAQRQIQAMANNSSQAHKAAQFQAMANNGHQHQSAIQMHSIANNKTAQLKGENEEEDVSHKELSTVQRKANKTGLPDNLKTGVENLSGLSMDDVKVHYNSNKPAQLQAHAYAQGTDIHVASGQEKHLPHEAWHVVQQKQGRVKPTKQLRSKVNINDDKGLEKEADIMGAKAVQMYSTSFYANPLTEPITLNNGNAFQLITIQKVDDDTKPAKLHIHADLDEPEMGVVEQLLEGEVGHAWISLEWKDSNNIPNDIPNNHTQFLSRGGMFADPMGFWPKKFKDYDPATQKWSELPADESVAYKKNPFNSYVAGQMLHPDNRHTPRATQSYELTHEQATAVINYAESKRGAQYSVYQFNCTTFARDATKAGGQAPPSMAKGKICYPHELYKGIVKNMKKGVGTTRTYDKREDIGTITGSVGLTVTENEAENNKKG